MAWNQTDLDAIDKAIKTGASRVQFTDRSVEYRSVDEMLKIRDLIKRELDPPSAGERNRIYPSYSKGLKP